MAIFTRFPNKFRIVDVENVVLTVPNYIEFDLDPKQFDGVKFIMKRHEQNHGINTEFTNGEIELDFDYYTGQNLIKKIYNTKGPEALIRFQYLNNESGEMFIDLVLDFYAEPTFTANTLKCSINRKYFEEQLRTRYETKINLLGNKDLNNNDVTPITPVRVTLPNKEIILQSSWKINPALQSTGPFAHTDEATTDVVIPWQIESSEIETTQSPVAGVLTVTDSPDRGLILTGAQITGIAGRTFTVNGRIRFTVSITEANVSPQFTATLMVVDPIGPSFTELVIGVGTFQGAMSGSRTFDFLINDTILQDVPFEYYIAFALRFSHAGSPVGLLYDVTVTYDLNLSFLEFTEVTRYPESTNDFIWLYDALNKGFEMTTGQANRLRSDFLGRTDRGYAENGCGANMSLSSGKKIRNFPTSGIFTSVQDLFEKSAQPLYNLGLGFETEEGQEYIRVEEMKYFYQDDVGYRFEEVFDYEEKVYTEYFYNEIRIAFKKYLEEELNTIDSVHTEGNYLTPIKRNKNKLDIEIAPIMDPYAFEYTRRLQFKDKPTESWRYDEDLFFMQLSQGEGFINVGGALTQTLNDVTKYNSELGQVTVDGIDITGQAVGATHFGVQYEVGANTYEFIAALIDVIYDPFTDQTYIYFIPGSLKITNATDAIGSVFFYQSQESTGVPEFNEPFDIAEGVIEPGSFANMRHTPKSILMRYGGLIKSGLYFHDVADIIKTTFVKNNGELKTRLKVDDLCQLHRRAAQTIIEKEDMIINLLGDENAYFLPEVIRFKAKIPWEDLLTIKANKYKLLQCIDSAGQVQSGWIKPGGELSYNPGNELLVECELIKKA